MRAGRSRAPHAEVAGQAIHPRCHNLTMSLTSRLACCSLLPVAVALLSSAGGASPPENRDRAERRARGGRSGVLRRGADARGGSTRFRSAPMPFLATEYAAMCEPELGRVPKIACDDGVLIPITGQRHRGVRGSRQPRLRQPGRAAGRLLAGLAPRTRGGARRRRQSPAPRLVGVLLPLGGPGEPRAPRLGLGTDDRLQPPVGRDLLLRGRRRPEVAARGPSRERRDPGPEAVGLVRRAPHGGPDAGPRRSRTSTTPSCRRRRPT